MPFWSKVESAGMRAAKQWVGQQVSVCSVSNSYFSDSPSITVDCVGTPWVGFISFFSQDVTWMRISIYCRRIILAWCERNYTHHCLENNCRLKQSKHWLLLFPTPGIYLPKLVCSVKMLTCSEKEEAAAGNMDYFWDAEWHESVTDSFFWLKWVLTPWSVLAGMFGVVDTVQSLVCFHCRPFVPERSEFICLEADLFFLR